MPIGGTENSTQGNSTQKTQKIVKNRKHYMRKLNMKTQHPGNCLTLESDSTITGKIP